MKIVKCKVQKTERAAKWVESKGGEQTPHVLCLCIVGCSRSGHLLLALMDCERCGGTVGYNGHQRAAELQEQSRGRERGGKILRKSKSANGQRQGDEEKEREVETCKMVVSGRSMSGQK